MKKAVIICLIILVFIMSACANNNEKTASTNTDESTSVQSSIIPDASVDTTQLSGFSWDNFNIETDDPVFMSGYHDIAVCDKGYYFVYSEILYFKDKLSNQCVPVCAKPDCTHEKNDLETCNAYFNCITFDYNRGMYYYDSNLYMLGNDGSGEHGRGEGLYLYKISMDGTQREMLYNLADFASSLEDVKLEFLIHRGKGYFSYSEETKSSLYSFDIDNKNLNMTAVDVLEGTAPEFYRLRGYGDYLIYQYFYYEDESLEKFSGGIKVYDGNNHQVLIKDAIKTYCITDSKVYYETSKGTKIYDIKTGKTSDFKTKNNAYAINYDGKYFYTYDNNLDKNYVVYVYSKIGEMIDTIKTPKDCFMLSFGDDELFFAETKFFEKADIGKANIDWEKNWQDSSDKYYNNDNDDSE